MTKRSRRDALGDDLLLEIFLRIGRPDDLVRASAACVAFRRLIIDDPTFFPRYHSRHKPLLLGVLSLETSNGFHPVEVPRPNTPAANAVANILSFKDHHLPQDEEPNCRCITRDVHDGHILLELGDPFRPDYAVYDPLTRRYLKLPPVPHYGKEDDDFLEASVVFAPCADGNKGKEEEASSSSFRVIALMHYETEFVVAAVFDSAGPGRSWSFGTSSSWPREAFVPRSRYPEPVMEYHAGHAYGCLYWKVYGESKLMKLDTRRMEFSTVYFPYRYEHDVSNIVVVEAEKGRLGMFTSSDGKFIRYYRYNRTPAAQSSSKDLGVNGWTIKKRIALPPGIHDLSIVGAPRGCVFLQLLHDDGSEHTTTCYSLDVRSFELERVAQMSSCATYFLGRPYFCSRPAMSPRRT